MDCSIRPLVFLMKSRFFIRLGEAPERSRRLRSARDDFRPFGWPGRITGRAGPMVCYRRARLGTPIGVGHQPVCKDPNAAKANRRSGASPHQSLLTHPVVSPTRRYAHTPARPYAILPHSCASRCPEVRDNFSKFGGVRTSVAALLE